MKHTISSDSFSNFLFRRICHRKYRYTDGRSGASMHFIGYLRMGKAKLVSGNGVVMLSPGDLFYIPKGEPYQSYWYGDEREVVEFDSFGFHLFPEADTRRFVLQKFPADERAKDLAAGISRTVDSAGLGNLYTLLSQLLPQMVYTDATPEGGIIAAAENYLWKNPHAKMGEVAQHCGISESGLYSAFSKGGGQTPNELRLQILSKKAAELLQTTDLPVETISSRLGFSSSSYFRKVFRKYTGKTPRELRNQAKWQ